MTSNVSPDIYTIREAKAAPVSNTARSPLTLSALLISIAPDFHPLHRARLQQLIEVELIHGGARVSRIVVT